MTKTVPSHTLPLRTLQQQRAIKEDITAFIKKAKSKKSSPKLLEFRLSYAKRPSRAELIKELAKLLDRTRGIFFEHNRVLQTMLPLVLDFFLPSFCTIISLQSQDYRIFTLL